MFVCLFVPAGDRRGHPPKQEAGEHVGVGTRSTGALRQAGAEPGAYAGHGVFARGGTQDRSSGHVHAAGVCRPLLLFFFECCRLALQRAWPCSCARRLCTTCIVVLRSTRGVSLLGKKIAFVLAERWIAACTGWRLVDLRPG